MPIVIGNLKEATHPDTLKAAVAEFISMLTYIFSAEGFAASSRLTSSESTMQSGLIAATINHSFALYVAVLMATNKSGGHVNPAATFGAFIGVSSFPPTPRNAVVFERVTTFGVVYTVYSASIDPKRTMNPPGLFGQAIVSWTWNSLWVHWLGTFVGAAIASLVYETIFITNKSDDDWPLPIIICGTNSTE
ncbi:hypothetical protein FXO38_27791 [Capsicum annuum]|uniref:Uncharacterized protein n=1 Tax=Capsicum annuum TaxID=4072 RepID=A0A2G2XXY0_CAPAN|nr:hypothetical protein FXO38_27791 [Capsicum annuum]PHT62366.1 hypothetical protein T459_33781 [Capsicum annuum]